MHCCNLDRFRKKSSRIRRESHNSEWRKYHGVLYKIFPNVSFIECGPEVAPAYCLTHHAPDMVIADARLFFLEGVWTKEAGSKRKYGSVLTEILKWPISDVGRISFVSRISPSRCRFVCVECTSCAVDAHQAATPISSTLSFHATSSSEVQVLLKKRTRRLRETTIAFGFARRSIACES